MSNSSDGNPDHISVALTIDGAEYRVLALTIREEVFSIPRLTAQLLDSSSDAPDPASVIGKPVDVELAREGEQPRVFHGIVIASERREDGKARSALSIEATASIWKLSKRRDCRVFQDMTAVEIATDVLLQAGVTEIQEQLTGSPPSREYVVQYRETDLAFVERTLAEDGVYFVTKHAAGKNIVVISDEPTGIGDVDGPKSITFDQEFGFQLGLGRVGRVKQEVSVQADKVYLRQYDFKRPRFTVEASAEGTDDGEKALEVYEYPARFIDDSVGKARAQALLDSLQAGRNTVRGESTVTYLTPGCRFEIEGHPYDSLNGELLILGVEIEYSDFYGESSDKSDQKARYRCEFRAIPTSKSKYRPPRRPRAVSIPGVQTAIVTGASGSEIHSDEHGRVKAFYHWDREGSKDDTSSQWMRTCQLPVGNSMLLPRVGWEVMVQHDEGDPDTPLVMSRVYNTESPPPYSLPGGKARSAMQTATTPGGGSVNEFRTDDSAGSEEMFFNASKDMTVDVLNNTTESVGNNETRSVGSNRGVNVTNSSEHTVGASQTIDVGGNQDVKVQTFKVDQCADHSLTVGGNRDMKIGGDHKRTVAANSDVTVGSMHTDLVVGSVSESTLANMTIDVGTARVTMTAGDHATMVGGVHSETIGAAKLIVAFGGRGVEIAGAMTEQVGGAILNKIDGDRVDAAGATFTEVAAGASIIKADNVTYEADAMISVVMGASTLMITPASVMIAGVSVKFDGATKETAALILDN